ncbi:hypothetical protein [Streptomyces sp. NPDC089795]|uniref:hypothetical protein n=1 Tax=Streptomyces sp. NPDC089795 TaxID=3155297 RepID=UPI0034466116
MRRAIRSLLVFGTVVASTVAMAGTGQATPTPPTEGTGLSQPFGVAASTGACVRAHVADLGWGDWFCGIDYYAGTVGRGKAIEALQIKVWGGGEVCARAHMRNTGWESNPMCREDGDVIEVGDWGHARTMEAVQIWFRDPWPGVNARLHGWGHIQNRGWVYKQPANAVLLGTEGQALRLEAVSLGTVL